MVKETDVIILGAGLTGLTLAHFLKKSGKNFIVVERNSFVGGAIQTTSKDGFVFEKGPSTGVKSNEVVGQLFDELGDLCKFEKASDQVAKRYILKDGKWVALPSGLIGGIFTPLFSFSDKLRLLGEPFRKPGTNPNETLEGLVKRRMGQTFLEYAVDPFILGVYAGDPSYIVPRFALPKLYNLEQNYGSFIGGTVKMHRAKAKTGELKKKKEHHRIFSVQGGLSNLTNALYQSASTENFILGAKETVVSQENGVYILRYKDTDNQNVEIRAKKLVTTVGAHELPAVLPFLDKTDVASISNLQYARVVQVALGFKKWNGFKLDAFGGLIPFKENRDVLGVLFPSASLTNRVPKDGVLLSVFLGGVRRPDIFEKTDDEIKQLLDKEIRDLMQLPDFAPDLISIHRYHHAIPQYGADCEARFAAVEKVQKQYPGLILGGNLRNGIGMADRILQAKTLADEICNA